jgi:8-oxo-dGTP pyrophosphatase MutT (NUDIX family)
MGGVRLAVLRWLYRLAYRMLQVWPGKPRDGVKCLLLYGDELLLVRHTYGPDVWQLPGGGAHRGEPPHRVAAREMEEELGVAGLQWQVLPAGEGRLAAVSGSSVCLWAELSDPIVHPDPVEIAQAHWFSWEALPAGQASEIEFLLALVTASRRTSDLP